MKNRIRERLFGPRASTKSSGIETLLFSLFNAVMNFTKSVIVASRYGASATSDAYYATVNLINAPATLLSDSLTATVLPRYIGHKQKNEERDYLSSYLSVVALAFTLLCVIFLLFGNKLAALVLGGFRQETLTAVDGLILLSLPTIVFAPLTIVLDSALRAERFFIFGNIGGAINSVVSVLLIFFLSRSGVSGVVVATVIGIAANLVILAWSAVRKGLLPGKIDLVMGIREAKAALPLLAGGIVGVATSYVEKYFASFLDAGTMTLLNMSSSIAGVAQGLLVGALISVYYPFVSAAVVANDQGAFDALMKKAMRLIFGVFGLAVICMITFADPLFGLLFGHGKFSADAVSSLSRLFGISSFGVIYTAIAYLANYAYYARSDTKSPVLVSLVTTSLGGVALQAALVGPLGAKGLLVALNIANLADLIAKTLWLRKKHGFKVLSSRDIILVLLLLAACLGGGWLSWSPWMLLAPVVFYLAISLGVFRLSPRAIVAILSRRSEPNEDAA